MQLPSGPPVQVGHAHSHHLAGGKHKLIHPLTHTETHLHAGSCSCSHACARYKSTVKQRTCIHVARGYMCYACAGDQVKTPKVVLLSVSITPWDALRSPHGLSAGHRTACLPEPRTASHVQSPAAPPRALNVDCLLGWRLLAARGWRSVNDQLHRWLPFNGQAFPLVCHITWLCHRTRHHKLPRHHKTGAAAVQLCHRSHNANS